MWKHLESIEWLISGARRSGRSTALALCFINLSINKQKPIEVFDHYDASPMSVDNILSVIKEIVRRLDIEAELHLTVKFCKVTIEFANTKRIKALREAGVLNVARTIMEE